MKLLPKSPLDSTPLGRGTGRGRSYFEESDPKSELLSERKLGGIKREGAKERPMHLLMHKNGNANPNHPYANKTSPPLPLNSTNLKLNKRMTQPEKDELTKQRTKG